jgi:hypothetical protein
MQPLLLGLLKLFLLLLQLLLLLLRPLLRGPVLLLAVLPLLLPQLAQLLEGGGEQRRQVLAAAKAQAPLLPAAASWGLRAAAPLLLHASASARCACLRLCGCLSLCRLRLKLYLLSGRLSLLLCWLLLHACSLAAAAQELHICQGQSADVLVAQQGLPLRAAQLCVRHGHLAAGGAAAATAAAVVPESWPQRVQPDVSKQHAVEVWQPPEAEEVHLQALRGRGHGVCGAAWLRDHACIA